MQLTRLRVLLIQELRRLFAAEASMGDVLNRLRIAAEAEEVKVFLSDVLAGAAANLHRLEGVSHHLGESPRGGHAESMRSLLNQAEDQLGSGGDPRVQDGAILVSMNRVIHWKIATYSILITYAKRIDLTEVAGLLARSLDEERALEERLERLAQTLELRSETEL